MKTGKVHSYLNFIRHKLNYNHKIIRNKIVQIIY